ncbi:MAG TPA: sugar ABC transporter ATP-binding protein, partial [Alphaproteobacteria bacterium]|nr:sugar ABC transporter ATP-binding protein [Alphaproteobacteria bacterium]
RLVLPLASDPPPRGTALTIGVRPEHFGRAGRGDADITVEADVAEHLGATSYVYANAGGEELVIERDPLERDAGTGRLTVSISAARAYAFDAAGRRLR